MKILFRLNLLFCFYFLYSKDDINLVFLYKNEKYDQIIDYVENNFKYGLDLDNDIIVCKTYLKIDETKVLNCIKHLEKLYNIESSILALETEYYYLIKDNPKTLDSIRKALRLIKSDYNYFKIYYYLGLIYIDQGYLNKAMVAFLSAKTFFDFYKDNELAFDLVKLINQLNLKLAYVAELNSKFKLANQFYEDILHNKYKKSNELIKSADYGYKRTLKELNKEQ